jgi:hypothetical protein
MAPAPRLVKIPDAGSWNSYNGKSALREATALSRFDVWKLIEVGGS